MFKEGGDSLGRGGAWRDRHTCSAACGDGLNSWGARTFAVPDAVWKPVLNLKVRPVKFADVLNAEVNMPRFIEGQDRQQVMLLPECLGDSWTSWGCGLGVQRHTAPL